MHLNFFGVFFAELKVVDLTNYKKPREQLI